MTAHKRKHKKGTADKHARSKLIARNNMAKIGQKVPVSRHRMRKGAKSSSKADLLGINETSENLG
jgi:hypothetical protein